MDVGADIIGMVKTNKKGFCMDTIEKITKYLPIGSYFVLKRMSIVPRYRPLLDIGYKNNSQKVLYFILTDDVWSANSGIPYLSKYHETFTNVSIVPVAHPLVVFNFLDMLIRLTTTTHT